MSLNTDEALLYIQRYREDASNFQDDTKDIANRNLNQIATYIQKLQLKCKYGEALSIHVWYDQNGEIRAIKGVTPSKQYQGVKDESGVFVPREGSGPAQSTPVDLTIKSGGQKQHEQFQVFSKASEGQTGLVSDLVKRSLDISKIFAQKSSQESDNKPSICGGVITYLKSDKPIDNLVAKSQDF